MHRFVIYKAAQSIVINIIFIKGHNLAGSVSFPWQRFVENLYFDNNKALVLITSSIVKSKVVDYDK